MTNKKKNDKRYQIVKKTKENMQNLGIYRNEFDATIRRYANLRLQYDDVQKSIDAKLKKSEDVSANMYKVLENYQKQLLEMENTLGLTPKGLKALQSKSMEKPKTSRLAEVLRGGI
ncbi:terminase [Faecalicoccus pleomorphus]|uniref:Terminase n=1 Tax=Faecalicoccus pleomorphus TaxID=1323 RepID=A0A3E3E594_9FIRM|nr:P27 family phage terminase small subunit [Faecalicoccus pleomorphus]RGD76358.1 terminase [Faecalicoccus pleomorphus]